MTPQWTPQQAHAWYDRLPLFVGANYTPATACNQIEMWQEKFDPEQIERELTWAEGMKMNTMRVFLHDLPWEKDPEEFKKRIDHFLTIAAKHHIKPMFVLFDSCWDPYPHLGEQRKRRDRHNGGWVQSPGRKALENQEEWPRLERYIKGVVGAFKDDPRILAWDVWNEPDNPNDPSFIQIESPQKREHVLALLPNVFQWVREAGATQPLTSGIWCGDWSSHATLSPIEKVQVELSDFISFHNYQEPDKFENCITRLERYGRPIVCTEYMARTLDSTFEHCLPIAAARKVGTWCWGFVQGDTNTHLPWDRDPYDVPDEQSTAKFDTVPLLPSGEEARWFHDVLRGDGAPYEQRDVDAIRAITHDLPDWPESMLAPHLAGNAASPQRTINARASTLSMLVPPSHGPELRT